MNICVYCASAEPIDEAYLELASDVGNRLAADGGAHTVGVIPAHLVPYEVADTDADELIVVDTMRERKRVMDDRADAFLALPGGLGTLEELFEVWTAASLGMHGKPVAVLDPDGYYQPLWDYLDELRAGGFVRAAALDVLRRTTTVDEAFSVLAP
jgi:hypothetical protein